MNWFTNIFKSKQSKAKVAGDCFNEYQKYFTSLDPTEESVDLTLTVRIRAYGSEANKQADWDRDWRNFHPTWGKVSAGTNISSDPPELWMDLRMSRGGLILPLHVLAHELAHSIHNADRRVADPDTLIQDIY